MGLVEMTIDAIRDAVKKRIETLKAQEALSSKIGDIQGKYEAKGGIEELELLIAHFPGGESE